MARILIATVPILGHVAPFLPLCRGLVTRGHDVRWYCGQKYRERIEAAGARFLPIAAARDYDDSALEGNEARAALQGIDKLKYDMKHVFIDDAPGQLADIRAITREFEADVVLVDPCMIGALFHTEYTGLPIVVLGVLPMSSSSVDTAPFGLGLAPNASRLGRIRNRALQWSVENVLFRDVQRHWNRTRAQVGLAPTG